MDNQKTDNELLLDLLNTIDPTQSSADHQTQIKRLNQTPWSWTQLLTTENHDLEYLTTPQLLNTWNLIRQIHTRSNRESIHALATIQTATDLPQVLKQFYHGHTQEEFIVLALDAANHVLDIQTIALGTKQACDIDIATILKFGLQSNAAGLITVHNHPDGTPRPSQVDFDLAHQLQLATGHCGLYLVDNVVVTNSTYYSMANHHQI